jgi:uncharacterized protein with HEPN domain
MRHDDALLLDMLLAAQDIREFTAGIDQAAFQANKLIRSAVMREVQVIGEAARMVSAEMRANTPKSPGKRSPGCATALSMNTSALIWISSGAWLSMTL